MSTITVTTESLQQFLAKAGEAKKGKQKDSSSVERSVKYDIKMLEKSIEERELDIEECDIDIEKCERGIERAKRRGAEEEDIEQLEDKKSELMDKKNELKRHKLKLERQKIDLEDKLSASSQVCVPKPTPRRQQAPVANADGKPKSYKTRHCKHGDDCKHDNDCIFWHPKDAEEGYPEPEKMPCKFGARCKFGAGCNFSHDDVEQTQPREEGTFTISECRDGENCTNCESCPYLHIKENGDVETPIEMSERVRESYPSWKTADCHCRYNEQYNCRYNAIDCRYLHGIKAGEGDNAIII
jgi:hypothetical protein